jgi:hypothetical protein
LQEKLAFPADMHADKFNDQHSFTDENTLVNLVHVSGLTILAINVLPKEQLENVVMHVDMQGSYQQWIAFINVLEQKKHLISVQKFSCKWTEKNNVQISMDVLLMQNAQVVSQQNSVKSQYNIFCTRENVDLWFDQHNVDDVLLSPLAQIKMVGYLQLGTHSQALVLLPNRMIRTVEVGSVVGVESGTVVEIDSQQIVVRLKSGKQVVVGE